MNMIAAGGLAAVISLAAFGAADAKGCLKGAVVGGVAGHLAGHHATVGAIGGCAVGHHMAHQKAVKAARAQSAPVRR